MAMSVGSGSHGLNSEMNVTPFIDVLLVLLIVFMTIVPVTPKGLSALVPQPPKTLSSPPQTIVVELSHDANGVPRYRINETPIAKDQLRAQLDQIYSTRAEKVLFVKADPDLTYSSVAEVIDIGHSVGVDHIGLITPKVAAGI